MYKGKPRNWYPAAYQEYLALVAEQFPNAPVNERGIILVKCTEAAIKSDRVILPPTFGCANEEPSYCLAKMPQAINFFFSSRYTPPLEKEIQKYRKKCQSLRNSPLQPPRTILEDFEQQLSTLERQLEASKSCPIHKELLEKLGPISLLKKYWSVLETHKQEVKPKVQDTESPCSVVCPSFTKKENSDDEKFSRRTPLTLAEHAGSMTGKLKNRYSYSTAAVEFMGDKTPINTQAGSPTRSITDNHSGHLLKSPASKSVEAASKGVKESRERIYLPIELPTLDSPDQKQAETSSGANGNPRQYRNAFENQGDAVAKTVFDSFQAGVQPKFENQHTLEYFALSQLPPDTREKQTKLPEGKAESKAPLRQLDLWELFRMDAACDNDSARPDVIFRSPKSSGQHSRRQSGSSSISQIQFTLNSPSHGSATSKRTEGRKRGRCKHRQHCSSGSRTSRRSLSNGSKRSRQDDCSACLVNNAVPAEINVGQNLGEGDEAGSDDSLESLDSYELLKNLAAETPTDDQTSFRFLLGDDDDAFHIPTYIYPYGAVFKGDFADCQRNGYGRLWRPDGSLKYEGWFLRDEFNGQGELFAQDGSRYHGKFKNGKFDGFGRFHVQGNQLLYEGTYRDGQLWGFGKYFYADGTRYEGSFKQVYNYPDQSRYEGEFKHGKRNGFGKLWDSNGKILYEGNFENDQYSGHGKLFGFYEGEFVKGAMVSDQETNNTSASSCPQTSPLEITLTEDDEAEVDSSIGGGGGGDNPFWLSKKNIRPLQRRCQTRIVLPGSKPATPDTFEKVVIFRHGS